MAHKDDKLKAQFGCFDGFETKEVAHEGHEIDSLCEQKTSSIVHVENDEDTREFTIPSDKPTRGCTGTILYYKSMYTVFDNLFDFFVCGTETIYQFRINQSQTMESWNEPIRIYGKMGHMTSTK